jgi:hypothetical protein
LRFHDLRHTTASLSIAAGEHPKLIQARLGHSSITVTVDRYGHLFPSMEEALAEKLDAAFTPPQRRRDPCDERRRASRRGGSIVLNLARLNDSRRRSRMSCRFACIFDSLR